MTDELAKLRSDKEVLLKALKEIANHPHNLYHTDGNSPYAIGIADGHRCAAKIAKAAIEEAKG